MLKKLNLILASQVGPVKPLKGMWKRSLTGPLVLAFLLGLSGWALAANIAGVYQEGDNKAYIEQVGNFNQARLDQSGYNNEACIEQYYGYYSWNKASQTQVGSFNRVYTHQEGNGNEAFVRQEGNNNGSDSSTCDRLPDSISFDTGGLTQYQYGNINLAKINILGSLNNTCQWQEGDNNTATIKITGDSNTAKQVQLNGSNIAKITIDGDFNTAYQYEKGGDISNITIEGDGISVYIKGSGTYPVPIIQ